MISKKDIKTLFYREILMRAPWGSLEKTLIQIEKLLDERSEKEDQNILLATKEKIESMKVS
jgi:hypothetical protein